MYLAAHSPIVFANISTSPDRQFFSHLAGYRVLYSPLRNSSLDLSNPNHCKMPIPVAVRSKAWVCRRSLAGIVGSNPSGVIEVCLL